MTTRGQAPPSPTAPDHDHALPCQACELVRRISDAQERHEAMIQAHDRRLYAHGQEIALLKLREDHLSKALAENTRFLSLAAQAMAEMTQALHHHQKASE